MKNIIDLDAWIDKATSNEEKEFRQAVKSILVGISLEVSLADLMVMKGGLLLAIKYESPRYTKDIDFSTAKGLGEVDLESFLESFSSGLIKADQNSYGLAFKLQKNEIRPSPKNNPTFPSLHLRIGYAQKTHASTYNKLLQKQSPKVVSIDFSFNEWIKDEFAEIATISGSGELKIYSMHEILAEKIRSLLQQPIRRRERYQDVYDIHRLIEINKDFSSAEKLLILDLLKKSCAAREVPVNSNSFDNPLVKDLAKKGYEQQLLDQLQEDPPDFDIAFKVVSDLYKSLPWKD